MEGSSNNAFASFADFSASDFNFGGTVTGISVQLQLTQSNASFTHGGTLNFYLSQDTTTGIDSGTSPSYMASAAPDGIDTQLAPHDLVGTATFTPGTINTNGTGTVDTYTLTLSPADQSYLIQQLNGGGNIRLIVAPGDATVAATYAGFANTSTSPVLPGPTLSIYATATPEPVAVDLLGIGALALVRRRRALEPHPSVRERNRARGTRRGLALSGGRIVGLPPMSRDRSGRIAEDAVQFIRQPVAGQGDALRRQFPRHRFVGDGQGRGIGGPRTAAR